MSQLVINPAGGTYPTNEADKGRRRHLTPVNMLILSALLVLIAAYLVAINLWLHQPTLTIPKGGSVAGEVVKAFPKLTYDQQNAKAISIVASARNQLYRGTPSAPLQTLVDPKTALATNTGAFQVTSRDYVGDRYVPAFTFPFNFGWRKEIAAHPYGQQPRPAKDFGK